MQLPVTDRAPSPQIERAPPRLVDERALLREGLTRPLPEISARYLYDDHGSALFEQITRLPSYYQTRAELQILERDAAELLTLTAPTRLIELGSGAGRKIRLLLDAWPTGQVDRTCTMLDINERFLRDALAALARDYPQIHFHGLVGDFQLDLPHIPKAGRRLILFFAGTIGNLDPAARRAFLRQLAADMGPEDALLVGLDLVKDPRRIDAAYNDPEGVTAAFNRNALAALNHRFGANFDLDGFAHRAFYDPVAARVEMRLVALAAQRIQLTDLDLELTLARGDELRTEISCKFTRDALTAEAAEAGLQVRAWRSDPDALFALALLGRAP